MKILICKSCGEKFKEDKLLEEKPYEAYGVMMTPKKSPCCKSDYINAPKGRPKCLRGEELEERQEQDALLNRVGELAREMKIIIAQRK